MEIIAVISKEFGDSNPSYIVKLSCKELSSVSMLTHTYGSIPVLEEGKTEIIRDCNKLKVGDVIPPEFIEKHQEKLATYISNRKDIERAMDIVKSSIDNLKSLTTPNS